MICNLRHLRRPLVYHHRQAPTSRQGRNLLLMQAKQGKEGAMITKPMTSPALHILGLSAEIYAPVCSLSCKVVSLLAGAQGRKGSSNVVLKSRRKVKSTKGSVEGAELNGNHPGDCP